LGAARFFSDAVRCRPLLQALVGGKSAEIL
jgi:hypothetical protein